MSNLDTAALETLKEVMEDEFHLLLDTFFEDSTQRLADLKQHVAEQDAEALRRTAHSLKGSASNLGALGLADLCLKAEAMGVAGNLTGAEALVASIHTEYESVSQALETYR
ncbi:Hpt domain-containing protein [Simiduia sp. 21SJ11W-1]|uniref:Hpt domain-containing protein n=1 Tax=Simiduia sp. 21SJ11W-1 TaxID=2909669 RepID=UPI00209F73B8|nr:Hpt domain-containing protein [Simiduia sp. 21SJ11W-1]UTA49490.1 Hpt domain-containing protein [Simiduia sp. 21SJ11W-1]